MRPSRAGSVDDRLARMSWAIAEGDKAGSLWPLPRLAKIPTIAGA